MVVLKRILLLGIAVVVAGVCCKMFFQQEARKEVVVEEKPPQQNPEPEPLKREIKEVNQTWRFFTQGSGRFPFVKTVSYSSRVPWLKGRPAWISDYASYFSTSRHFIARSLNKGRDYEAQKVIHGDRLNVFDNGKNINFYLHVNLATKIMTFYYIDLDENIKELVRTYRVGVGRPDPTSPSYSLTPIGKYSLGDKVAIYRHGTTGYFNNKEQEMVNIFGTRWLPLGEELADCSHGSKGYGVHGLPCRYDEAKGMLVEEKEHLGQCTSDGCIRMQQADIEELYAIVITKPTVLEIVNLE